MMRVYSSPGITLAEVTALFQSVPAESVTLTPAATVNVSVLESQVYTLVVGASDTVNLVPGSGAFDGATCWILADNTAGGTLTIDGGDPLESTDHRVTFVCTDASAGDYDAVVGSVL